MCVGLFAGRQLANGHALALSVKYNFTTMLTCYIVDDLLVYEGTDAVDLAVEQSADKITTLWATIKTQSRD